MKKLAEAILMVCACAGLAFAQAQTPPAAAPAKAPSVSDAVKQLEHDWTDAMNAGDVDKFSAIVADDWVCIIPNGSKTTKKILVAAMKSSAEKIEPSEFGPMDVKVMGSIAVVQGCDTESATNGKGTNGKRTCWMDVFVKRDGKWVVVRSEIAIVN